MMINITFYHGVGVIHLYGERATFNGMHQQIKLEAARVIIKVGRMPGGYNNLRRTHVVLCVCKDRHLVHIDKILGYVFDQINWLTNTTGALALMGPADHTA